VIPIPNSISYDAAATLGVTYGTAYHMLAHLGNMSEGESVLIHHAAGGVGTAAVQICQAYGVTNIIGTASSSKKEFVESLGMRFVDRDSEDFVRVCKDATDGKGVHHALDPVGGKHLMRSYKALRNGGKLYSFGASAAVSGPKRNYFSAFNMWRSTPKFNPLIMMKSNKAIFGVHMGKMDDSAVFETHMMELAKMLQQGKIEPIIDSVWRFEQVADAQQHMHDRKNRGKVLLDFS
jgi:NADPH:quinone reductase-like Zn-dependent oxidoreductase